jgi:hypothetical protein
MTRADYVTLYASPLVTVLRHATAWEVYRVTPRDGRARTFRGESAWAAAARYAYDYDRNAIGCTA